VLSYLILAGVLVFWVVYYLFEGNHDVAFIRERDAIHRYLNPAEQQEVAPEVRKYEKAWHMFDAWEKTLVKLLVAGTVYLLTTDLLFTVQMLILSLFIRVIVHDAVVARGLGKTLNHIAPSDDILWAVFLRTLLRFGIPPIAVKLFPTLLLVTWIVWYISTT